MPARDQNHEAWNEEMAQRYDPDLFHNHRSPLVRFVRNRRVAAIHRLLGVRPHHRVLDVGCGAGNILAEMTCERVGIDLSDFLLAKAKQRLGDSAALVKGSVEALPFEDNSFDRAYCSEVLEHVADPRAVFREIARVLTSDGIAVVTIPNEALIDTVKGILVKTRLYDLVTRRKAGGYDMPVNMKDEWHLTEFSGGLLRQMSAPYFHILGIKHLPFAGLPLGFAARLRPR